MVQLPTCSKKCQCFNTE